MKRPFATVLITVILTLILPLQAYALNSRVPNNIYGIHLATPSKEELEDAAKLVNSNGGSWGYVTVVIQENDRDQKKWQEAFDRMRKLRLIPIVRLATRPEGATWKKGSKDEVGVWIAFLQSLRWVAKERYVVLFNEPNHSREWGGELDPEGYGDVASAYARALHDASSDYVVMLAGIDIAAASNGEDMDAFEYYQRMFRAHPTLSEQIDALSSHSYPNPGFKGSPYATGRLSILGYAWELELLRSLGVTKELPVFITETGWTHNGTDTDDLTEKFLTAFSLWKNDTRVRAVTPFILSYQGDPFLHFSWQKLQAREFYPHYYSVQRMAKEPGAPEQYQKGNIRLSLPNNLLEQSSYHLRVILENNGQAYWTRDDGYALRFAANSGVEYFIDDLSGVEPGKKQEVAFYLKTTRPGTQRITVELVKNDAVLLSSKPWKFTVVPLPDMTVQTSLLPRLRTAADRTFEVQLFNDQEELVYKETGLRMQNGRIRLEKIRNVYLGGRFRVVVLTKYFLPRQTYAVIEQHGTTATLKPLLPLDFDADGGLSWGDVGALITNPRLLRLLLP